METLEYWPTSEGLHIVDVAADKRITFVGILWIEA